MNTPELNKMHEARERLGTEHIGAFLEWLDTQGIFLARYWDEDAGGLTRHNASNQELLAEYAGVDLAKVEEERRVLLDELRSR